MNCLDHGSFPEEGSCPACEGVEQVTTKQERVSDEELMKLIEGKELGGEIRSALALKELQQLRAVLPKVREALEFYADESSTYSYEDFNQVKRTGFKDMQDKAKDALTATRERLKAWVGEPPKEGEK